MVKWTQTNNLLILLELIACPQTPFYLFPSHCDAAAMWNIYADYSTWMHVCRAVGESGVKAFGRSSFSFFRGLYIIIHLLDFNASIFLEYSYDGHTLG